MICVNCGCDKDAYRMVERKNQPSVCFDCAGDVECIRCHQTQTPSEFRVQGRICHDCKNAMKLPRRKPAAKRYQQFAYGRKVVECEPEQSELLEVEVH